MDARLESARQWLNSLFDCMDYQFDNIAGDASFRRYFRVSVKQKSYVLMDAPPTHENCTPFVNVDNALADAGVNVPKIVHQDLEQGFLLLSDFGDDQYFRVLSSANVDALYTQAFNELIKIQQCCTLQDNLPKFDQTLYHDEWLLFYDWMLQRYLKLTLSADEQTMLNAVFQRLVTVAMEQPQVFVHRDYHSRNLMLLPDHQVGVLDFQDAVLGPITYDLVSLLRDCYVAWPLAQVEAWVEQFYQQSVGAGLLDGDQVSATQYLTWFDWMGMQRNLKAIGIFTRLCLRDGKSLYLDAIPVGLQYIVDVSANHSDLAEFNQFLRDRVTPAIEQVAQNVDG